ncbi:MAG: response regulator [Cyanosarcina radialis HA8281-LM2]|jgi:two-component system response regulator|nr:response regulator [Cyanosarcina radialis HA8281-LM2]
MAKQKVLIVDDGKVIRMQIREMLPHNTFDVLEAQDGIQGLNLIRQERPHLILLDCFMPRMNGWEVLEQLETDREVQATPLIVMSGRKAEIVNKIPNLEEYFEFIEKPFDQKALISAIRAAASKAKLRHQKLANRSSDRNLGGSIPHAAAEEIQQLKAVVQRLTQKNETMQGEIDLLKKQVSQLMMLVKQRMS